MTRLIATRSVGVDTFIVQNKLLRLVATKFAQNMFVLIVLEFVPVIYIYIYTEPCRGLSTLYFLEGPAGLPLFFLKKKEKKNGGKKEKKEENGEKKGKRKKKELMQRGPMGLQGAPRKSQFF